MTIEISMSGVIDEAYFTARIVEDLVTEVTDRVTKKVAEEVDPSDIAQEFDTYEIAEYVSVSDVASNIELCDLAKEIVGDMDEDLYQKVVAEIMSTNTTVIDQVVCRLRSQDDTMQTYDGVQETYDAVIERVKVLEGRLNGVMLLLDNFSCDASRTDLRVIPDNHPVM